MASYTKNKSESFIKFLSAVLEKLYIRTWGGRTDKRKGERTDTVIIIYDVPFAFQAG